MTAGSIELDADWAVMSKEDGSPTDYGVAAASTDGGLTVGAYAEIFSRLNPGRPPHPGTTVRTDALPWITVGFVPARERHDSYLGVAEWTWTEKLDAAHRPIVEARLLCVPHAKLHGTVISYRTLHEALRGLGTPAGRAQARLALPVHEPAAAAEVIARFGFARVAAAAAAVLRGPHAILDVPTRDGWEQALDRLDFLNAVAALLPYGNRARLLASTWADVGAGHGMRLAPSARPRSGQGVLRWHGPHEPINDASVATRYHRTLLDLADAGHRVEDLVGHLAAQTEPRRVDDSIHAFQYLRRISGAGAPLLDYLLDATAEEQLRWLYRPGGRLATMDARRLVSAFLRAENRPMIADLVAGIARRSQHDLWTFLRDCESDKVVHDALTHAVLRWLPTVADRMSKVDQRVWMEQMTSWAPCHDAADAAIVDLLTLRFGRRPSVSWAMRLNRSQLSPDGFRRYRAGFEWALHELLHPARSDDPDRRTLVAELVAWAKSSPRWTGVSAPRAAWLLGRIGEVDPSLVTPSLVYYRDVLNRAGAVRR